MAICASSRANAEPKHTCAPAPKARCGFGLAFNVWQIGVDDIREIFDVDPARCDIGREKQCELSRLKCLQYFGALNFFRLAVKDADFYMMKFELFGIYV